MLHMLFIHAYPAFPMDKYINNTSNYIACSKERSRAILGHEKVEALQEITKTEVNKYLVDSVTLTTLLGVVAFGVLVFLCFLGS